MMPRKTFTREYKLEVIELARTSGKSKAQLERELGLTPGLIGNWEKALLQAGQDWQQAFPGTGHQTETEAELRRLRRELEIVRQERDILKSHDCLRQTCGKVRPALKFAFMRAHRAEFEMKIMCRVLGVSCSGYHTWLRRQEPGQQAQPAGSSQSAVVGANLDSVPPQPRHIWLTTHSCRVASRWRRVLSQPSSPSDEAAQHRGQAKTSVQGEHHRFEAFLSCGSYPVEPSVFS